MSIAPTTSAWPVLRRHLLRYPMARLKRHSCGIELHLPRHFLARINADENPDFIRVICGLLYGLVSNLQAVIDDRERLSQLVFSDAEWRVREEGVPANECVETFLAEELSERLHFR